jgi:hypothetical protein
MNDIFSFNQKIMSMFIGLEEKFLFQDFLFREMLNDKIDFFVLKIGGVLT